MNVRPPRVEIPCVHLGGETRQLVPQSRAGHPGRRRLRVCAVHGQCHPTVSADGIRCCLGCPDARPDVHTLVAPGGTRGRPWPFQGRLPRKPWEYRVSACIPHLGTPDQLAVAIETLRWQTVTPYVIVVDTGSTPDVCERLERMRCEDVEIHYLRSHGYRHPSEPVAVALDLAHSVCHTEYLYHTHADVFIRRATWLEWLLDRCSADCPVVGYEMSERSGHEEWRGTVSHTATMLHAPTMRRIGASWNMQSWYETRGVPTGTLGTWPDTESMLRASLDRAGVIPLFVGPDTCAGAKHERNYTRDTDVNLDHVRSFPSYQLYGGPVGGTAAGEMPTAMREALQRVAEWRLLLEPAHGELAET